MDGLKCATEAMMILDELADVLTITTLKGMHSPSAPLSSSSSGHITNEDSASYTASPGSNREAARLKMVNSCSQTEEHDSRKYDIVFVGFLFNFHRPGWQSILVL
jgi:hypothetical protein